MIVVDRTDGGLRIVEQAAHAKMAADIARAWRRPEAMPESMWTSLIDAVEHHDDGWIEADQSPQLDAGGRPLAFNTMPPLEHIKLWRSSVERVRKRGPYASLLVALHARWLYTRYAGDESEEERAAVQGFIDELAMVIDEALSTLRGGDEAQRKTIEPTNLSYAQRLVSYFDALSLMMLGAIEIQDHAAPVAFGKQVQGLHVTPLKKMWQFWPWPFRSPRINVTIEALDLAESRFSDVAAFQAAREAATAQTLKWVLTGG